MYFLTSPRLGLRCWSSDDLALANALWGDPKVTSLIGGPFSARQVQQRLDQELACMKDHRVQYWPVFLLDGGQHAGCAGLHPYARGEQVYELGFHLRPEYWGRGMAEEAGRAVIAYAFESLGVKSLFAGHHPDNLASRKVLVKLGFKHTGQELYPPTGLMHPSYSLSPMIFAFGAIPRTR